MHSEGQEKRLFVVLVIMSALALFLDMRMHFSYVLGQFLNRKNAVLTWKMPYLIIELIFVQNSIISNWTYM